jgi:serine/threonine protein kinase
MSVSGFRVSFGAGQVEIPRVFGKYEIIRCLSYGTSCHVVLVRIQGESQEFACKIIPHTSRNEINTADGLDRELQIMKRLHHPGIIQFIDVFTDTDYTYIILEYCPYGDLSTFIEQFDRLDDLAARLLFTRLVGALQYLHSHGITHRDLKPENILLDANFHPKIADFGLSAICTPTEMLSTPCGTPTYVAPEILQGRAYRGPAVDVWSLGVVLYVMTVGRLPWTFETIPELYRNIQSGEFTLPVFISGPLGFLIRGMLTVDPKQRLTLAQVADHPWLKPTLHTSILPIGIWSKTGAKTCPLQRPHRPEPNQTRMPTDAETVIEDSRPWRKLAPSGMRRTIRRNIFAPSPVLVKVRKLAV